MIELDRVTKIYRIGRGVRVVALRDVSLRVERGEFIAVMGPSGSGKTTMLNLMGAMDRPTRGRVLIDGIDISELGDRELSMIRRKKIGFVFQSFNLIPTLTALENVMVPAIPTGMPVSQARRRARELLELVGLGDRIHHKPAELSGGQQQRVAIARALMNDPEIVLADEPTGELDTRTGDEIMRLLRKINEEQGVTVVVVTHDPRVARFAEKIVYLRDGRIERIEKVRDRLS